MTETEIAQAPFENEVRQLTGELVNLIEARKKTVHETYIRLLEIKDLTGSRKIRRTLRKLDILEKGIGKIKSGVEMAIEGERIYIDDEPEIEE